MKTKMQPRTKVIRMLAEYLRLVDTDLTVKDAVSTATFQHDLVYQAMQLVAGGSTPQKRGKEGKVSTDYSKPIVDASNPTQVDLMGGPKNIKI